MVRLFNFKPYTPAENAANNLAERIKRGETIEEAPTPDELLEENNGT